MQAIDHCTKGIGIWDFASNDEGAEPDVVMACAGDIPTSESLAAVAILRERCPKLKIRFVNVVDLFRLMPESEHPHGMSDMEFDALFTVDKPVIFNFHAYRVSDPQADLPAQEPREHPCARIQGEGQHQHAAGAGDPEPDRPLRPGAGRDRPRAEAAGHGGAHREWLKDQIVESVNYAHQNGIDRPEITGWHWPLSTLRVKTEADSIPE